MTSRGRPPLRSDGAVLDAALAAFASNGYAAMSVRALNADLGLSHETVSKRFGSKAELFRAAVTYGVTSFLADFDREIAQNTNATDLERLRATVRAFVVVSSLHPALGDLLHHESIGGTEREILVNETGLGERLVHTAALLARLREAGQIGDMGLRELWFLAHGAASPLHHPDLSSMFDSIDGPVDAEALIDRMTDLLMRGIRT